ncbi:MAG: hypothetical protein J5830_03995 [Clostridia bacterium]|nr:hypothetical protein [Clostridia bacterium]
MGSSLGAFYLLQFDRGIPRILINPALPENLTNIGGRKEFVSALEKQFENVKDVSRGPAVIYCGEDDDVAPNFGYFSGRYNNDKSNVRVLSVPRMNHHLSRDAMLGPIDGDLSRLKQHCSANPRGTNLK